MIFGEISRLLSHYASFFTLISSKLQEIFLLTNFNFHILIDGFMQAKLEKNIYSSNEKSKELNLHSSTILTLNVIYLTVTTN